MKANHIPETQCICDLEGFPLCSIVWIWTFIMLQKEL